MDDAKTKNKWLKEIIGKVKDNLAMNKSKVKSMYYDKKLLNKLMTKYSLSAEKNSDTDRKKISDFIKNRNMVGARNYAKDQRAFYDTKRYGSTHGAWDTAKREGRKNITNTQTR